MEGRICQCGTEVEYDGYNSIEIVDGYIEIQGEAKCPHCGIEYYYTESHVADFNNPFDIELEEVE